MRRLSMQLSETTSNQFDLFYDKWSIDQFKQNKLKVLETPDLHLLFEPQETINVTYLSAFTAGWKNWRGNNADDAIYKVSKAINDIALTHLTDRLTVKTQLEKCNSLAPTTEKMKVIQIAIAELQTLSSNLENHETLVTEFNNKFYTNLSFCSNHQAVMQLATSRLKTFRDAQLNLTAILEKEISDNLLNIYKAVSNGSEVNKDFILQKYSQIQSMIDALPNEEMKKKYSQKLNMSLNSFYLIDLSHKLKGFGGGIKTPFFIETFLNDRGFDKNTINEKCENGRKVFQEYLKTVQDQQSESLSNISSPDLISMLENKILSLITQEFPELPSERLQTSLKAIWDCERYFQSLQKTVVNEQRKKFNDDLNSQNISENRKKIIESKIQQCTLLDYSLTVVNWSLLFLQPKDLKGSETDFLKMIEDLNDDIEYQKGYYSKEYLSSAMEATFKESNNWFERNKSKTLFTFDQGQWTGGRGGVCAAKNFRWIKMLIDKPDIVPKSYHDLENSSQNDIEEVGVSLRDRMDQSLYSLELFFSKNEILHIGESILKRDKMCAEYWGKADSIEELIERVNAGLTYNPYPRVILDIGAYGEESAHAMGMQIDHTRKLYRFWDVNTGFYSYESVENMKLEFQGYIRYLYENKFTSYQAYQYLRLGTN